MPLNFGPSPAVVVRERTYLPKALVYDVAKVCDRLTIVNEAVEKTRRMGFAAKEDVPSAYYLYEETPEYLIVPRAVDWRSWVRPCRVIDMCGRSSTIGSVDDRVVLGPHESMPFDQRPGYDALVSKHNVPPHVHGRIFVLRCGGGKTAIALKAAAARGGRTLWVTVTDALAVQTRADISRYLGLADIDIGHIQAGRRKTKNHRTQEECGIAVATLQTLAVSDIDPLFWSLWDLVIFDEGDLLATSKFHTVAPRFRAERWLLTATPSRSDGMDELFRAHIGPVVYNHTKLEIVPNVWFVPAKGAVMPATAGYDFRRKQPRVSLAATAIRLLSDPDRQAGVLTEIRKALEKPRTVLAIGDSREGLGLLTARAKAEGIDAELVISGDDKKTRADRIHRPRVVFASTRIFQRGISRVEFDTIVATTLVAASRALWVQLGGRAGRYDPKNPDKRSLVIIVVDMHILEVRMLAAKLADLFSGMRVHNNSVIEDQPWHCHGAIVPKLLEERRSRR